MNEAELTKLFRRLGATEPEAWASSELNEGIPQLARYLFLRQAWRAIISEDDTAWVDESIACADKHPAEPYAGIGHALKKLRVRGATDQELTDVVRGMQAKLLFKLCCLLEDPGDLEPEVADLSWAIVQTDGNGSVVGVIPGLHESVLETDPTGRECRPREVAG